MKDSYLKEVIKNLNLDIAEKTQVNDNATDSVSDTYSAAKIQELIAGIPAGSSFDGTLDDITEGTTNKHFTSTEQTKLSGIAAGAEVNVNADWNSGSGDSQILNKPTLLALGETSATAYRGDRGKTAYDYSQVGHLPLTGGVITGRLGFNSVLTPTEEMVEHAGETTIILDASSAAVSANIGDGASYINMILFVVCVDVTNGASLVGTIQGGANYTFTAAGECLILKQVDATSPSAWWIVGKYTP